MMQTAREGRSLLHEGCIDVAAILGRLPQMPYSIEAPNKSLLAELGAAEFARRNLEAAKSYLATVHPVTKGED
jgi:sugar phosphate isomerase/epimerase